MRKKYYLIFLFFGIVFCQDNFFQKVIVSIVKNIFPNIGVDESQGALVISAISGALSIPAGILYFFAKDPYEKFLLRRNFLNALILQTPSHIKSFELAGYNKEREILREILNIFNKKEKFSIGNVLLYGPPGTGKSEAILEALKTANLSFIKITPKNIFNKNYSPEESLELILEKIKKQNKKIVIVFEEIDMLCPKREMPSTEQRMLISMLLFFDEIKKLNELGKKIMTISTTNYKEFLDSAFLRPGRTDKCLFFNPQEIKNKTAVFELYMNKYNLSMSSEDIKDFLKEDLSPAEIENRMKEKFLFIKKNN